MNSETKLSAHDSIALISGIILQAKGNIQRYNFFFLLWGWVIVLANLGSYILTTIRYSHPYYVWVITVPAWIYTLVKSFTFMKSKSTRTHFDKIHIWLWITYGITIMIVTLFGSKINYQLNPLILLLTAIPTLVSGIIIRFTPLILGGVTFWIGGIVCFMVTIQMQPLVGAGTIICGYLIPGYLLKNKPADV